MTQRFVVPEDLGGQRLDVVVARLVDQLSRRGARRLVDEGRVFLDGKRVHVCSRAVHAGARIELQDEGVSHAEAPPPRILHLSDHVVVVDKTAGVPTEPTREGSRGTLLASLQDALRQRGLDTSFLHAAHRLDTHTTGVVIFARNADAAHHVGRQLHDGTAERRYLALVAGVPAFTHARLDASLSRERDKNGCVRVDPEGAPAVTLVTVLAPGKTASLALCAPRTGRTHQLRVHLAHAGHPLVGDRQYGGGRARHLGLHALSLSLLTPSGAAVRYAAEPPDSFCAAAVDAGIPASVVVDLAQHLVPELAVAAAASTAGAPA